MCVIDVIAEQCMEFKYGKRNSGQFSLIKSIATNSSSANIIKVSGWPSETRIIDYIIYWQEKLPVVYINLKSTILEDKSNVIVSSPLWTVTAFLSP